MEAEGRGGDDPGRAERAAGDLGQIEAGDVLHHLAAALGDGAVGADDRDADDQVAHGSIAGAARAEVAGRDDASDRGPVGEGRIEREHLALGARRLLQLRIRAPASAMMTMSDEWYSTMRFRFEVRSTESTGPIGAPRSCSVPPPTNWT